MIAEKAISMHDIPDKVEGGTCNGLLFNENGRPISMNGNHEKKHEKLGQIFLMVKTVFSTFLVICLMIQRKR
jgi:hypothetical protein